MVDTSKYTLLLWDFDTKATKHALVLSTVDTEATKRSLPWYLTSVPHVTKHTLLILWCLDTEGIKRYARVAENEDTEVPGTFVFFILRATEHTLVPWRCDAEATN